jgi:hypothetical protein
LRKWKCTKILYSSSNGLESLITTAHRGKSRSHYKTIMILCEADPCEKGAQGGRCNLRTLFMLLMKLVGRLDSVSVLRLGMTNLAVFSQSPASIGCYWPQDTSEPAPCSIKFSAMPFKQQSFGCYNILLDSLANAKLVSSSGEYRYLTKLRSLVLIYIEMRSLCC